MSGQLVPSMDVEECEKLRECETTIDKGLRNFVDVGMALLEIQQHRLYRGTFPTFAQYCKERWGMSGRRGYQMIEAAQIVGLLPFKAGDAPPVEVGADVTNWSHSQNVNNCSHSEDRPTPAPTSESSIRPLTQLPKEQVADTYVRAVEIAGGKSPTAGQTQQAVDERNKLANAMGYKTPEEAVQNIERPVPSDGMRLAGIAIKRLEGIADNDTQRDEALDLVSAWIRRQK